MEPALLAPLESLSPVSGQLSGSTPEGSVMALGGEIGAMSCVLDPPFSKLGASITSGGGSLWVIDPSVLGGQSELVIGHEVVEITGGSGTSGSPWTIDRAGRGTTPRRHLAGAKVSGLPHQIVIDSGSGVGGYYGRFGGIGMRFGSGARFAGGAPDVRDYTARWGKPRRMRRTTISPGGYGEFSFTVTDRAPLTATPALGSNVEVSDNYGVYWQGIVDDVNINWRPNGSATVDIVCRGYALTADDDIYTSSRVFDAYTPIYQIMKSARDELCPLIGTDDSRLWGGGRSILVASSNMIGKTAQEVWSEVAAQGDSDGVPILYHVWRGDGGEPILETIRKNMRLRTYNVPLDHTTGLSAVFKRARVRNKIAVEFSEGYAQSIDSGAGLAVGATRGKWVPASNQLDSYGVAKQVADTMLAVYSPVTPLLQAVPVRYAATRPSVTNNYGDYVPLWRVDAGATLLVSSLDSGNDTLPTDTSYFVKSTEFDYDRRVLTIQTEEIQTVEGLTGQFLKQQQANPSSPIHTQPSAPAMSPHATYFYGGYGDTQGSTTAPNLPSPLPASASDRRVNYRTIAQGLDKVTQQLQWGDGGETVLLVGKRGLLTHVNPYKLLAVVIVRDNKDHTAAACTVSIGKSTIGTYPIVDPIVPAVIDLTTGSVPGFSTRVDFSDEDDATKFNAGDYVVFDLSSLSGDTSLINITVYTQRLPGELAQNYATSNPIIQGVSTSGLGAGIMNVVITTKEPCTTQVEYGETTNYGSTTPASKGGYVHVHTVRGLAVGTTYEYRATALNSHSETSTATGTFHA